MDTIYFFLGMLLLPGPSYTNSDNLALLAGTLRTTKRAACDDQMVSLSCPSTTIISVQFAQYGKAVPGGHSCVADPQLNIETEECLWPNPMQYSLLQTVVEACQKKPQCKFSTKLKPGQKDPCPRSRKFVEVAYKCRPQEFRGRTGCEEDVVKLSCNAHSRLAIYDAQYGRTALEANICSQPPGASDETCFTPHAVEKVIKICHGRRSCQILARNDTFGSNCRPQSRNTLKVVYACVPLGVLKEQYERAIDGEEAERSFEDNSEAARFEESDIGENWKEPNVISPNVNVQRPLSDDEDTSIEISTKLKDEETQSVKESKYSSNTKFVIYISVGVLVFILVASIIFAVRCYKKRKRDRDSKNGDMFTTETPNVFNEMASDIDNDVDVSHISGTFFDPVHPDMIIYRDGQTKTALRAMKPLSTVYPCAGSSMYGVDYQQSRSTRFMTKESDPEIMMSPKSLHGYTNSQFYYG